MNPRTFEELTWYRTVDIFHQDLKNDLKPVLKAGPNEAERKRLKSVLIGARWRRSETLKPPSLQPSWMTCQHEQLALQNQMAEEFRLLVRGREVQPEAKAHQHRDPETLSE